MLVSGALASWQARKVVTYIESNLSGAILVEVLARIASMSASRFHRAFRLRFGVTPHTYVTAKRIELAQCLMLTTSYSLSQISLACGMSDQAHFTRVFRKITGETPRRWAASPPEPLVKPTRMCSESFRPLAVPTIESPGNTVQLARRYLAS